MQSICMRSCYIDGTYYEVGTVINGAPLNRFFEPVTKKGEKVDLNSYTKEQLNEKFELGLDKGQLKQTPKKEMLEMINGK